MADKDLLGDPIVQPPAMNDSLPWRVFQLTDYEWWIARTMQEAKDDAARAWGFAGAHDPEAAEQLEDAYELSDQSLDTLIFEDDDQDPPVRRTFRAEIAHRVAAGLSAPELFAMEE